jgi:hypothetical protein
MSSHRLTHGERKHKCLYPGCTKSFTRPGIYYLTQLGREILTFLSMNRSTKAPPKNNTQNRDPITSFAESRTLRSYTFRCCLTNTKTWNLHNDTHRRIACMTGMLLRLQQSRCAWKGVYHGFLGRRSRLVGTKHSGIALCSLSSQLRGWSGVIWHSGKASLHPDSASSGFYV